MEQEPESGEDSHAQAESATEEETPLPDTISDEYYNEICTRANEVCLMVIVLKQEKNRENI